MNKKQFQAEQDYLSAREIAISLLRRSLLTDEEFGQIDQILRKKFSAVFAPLIADFPCYVGEPAA